MVIQYKCPDCGADMVFDSKTGMLTCESCGRMDTIEQMDHKKEHADEPIQDYQEFQDQTSYQTYGEADAKQYQCKNCGAILITDADTSATTCNFCGAPMILGDRLSGSLAPAKVVPFKISKQEAEAAFRSWCKKGRLTPKGFLSADRIKSITGIYVPFWLFDMYGKGETHAECTRTHHYVSGEYNVTETKYYDVYRKVEVNYTKIPCDASEKMDDTLMDKLEPFHYSDLKQFEAPYLAGYIAEKYNYTDQDLLTRIKQRTNGYVQDYLRSTIQGYDSVRLHHEHIDTTKRNAEYTLLPVWMICYDYNKAEHTFAMNGQTGKVVGKPPISFGKVAAWFSGISVSLFLILRIITLLLGGPIL